MNEREGNGATAERELADLALLLEAEAAEADPRFRAELDERVAAGFPRERRRPRAPRLPALPRPRLAMAGALASAVLAVGVVAALQDQPGTDTPLAGDTGSSAGGEALSTREAAPDIAVPGMTVPPTPVPPVGPDPGFAPGQAERRIERSARLTLAAPADRLDRVGDGVVTVTERYRGFVLSSSLTTGEDGSAGGTYELRIPADRLQPALSDLAELGEVRARTQSGQDVTPGFVATSDRLQAARAERRSLLGRLEEAATDSQAEALRARLDINAREVRGLRSELRALAARTNYAAVSVTLEEEGADDGLAAPADGLEGAVDDSVGTLSDVAELLIRALGVILPLALLGALAFAAARILRRRRREAALS